MYTLIPKAYSERLVTSLSKITISPTNNSWSHTTLGGIINYRLIHELVQEHCKNKNIINAHTMFS